MNSVEYLKHHKISDRTGHPSHNGVDRVDSSSEANRRLAAHHAQSVQQPHSDGNTKHKYDLPMSSYHPVISQDFNPLKTTMGQADDDIPNESALYRQINQTSSDMQQYRQPVSDRTSAQHRQPSEKQYVQNMPATEKGSIKGHHSSQAS